jgi:hypothetical protein
MYDELEMIIKRSGRGLLDIFFQNFLGSFEESPKISWSRQQVSRPEIEITTSGAVPTCSVLMEENLKCTMVAPRIA